MQPAFAHTRPRLRPITHRRLALAAALLAVIAAAASAAPMQPPAEPEHPEIHNAPAVPAVHAVSPGAPTDDAKPPAAPAADLPSPKAPAAQAPKAPAQAPKAPTQVPKAPTQVPKAPTPVPKAPAQAPIDSGSRSTDALAKAPVAEVAPAGEADGKATTAKKKKKKSVGDLFRKARGSHRISGIKELFEWALVLILIAPGTFPAMSCVILACAAFWRRQARSFWPAHRPRGPAQDVAALAEGQTRSRRRNQAGEDAVVPGNVSVPLLPS